jgi:hypothetical protein
MAIIPVSVVDRAIRRRILAQHGVLRSVRLLAHDSGKFRIKPHGPLILTNIRGGGAIPQPLLCLNIPNTCAALTLWTGELWFDHLQISTAPGARLELMVEELENVAA